ncbi:hypothetical protein QFZ20_000032 [Flavobacterium sp. W4I14]|nr:hypothetical protein [Flavobacterium sp. W4I14]
MKYLLYIVLTMISISGYCQLNPEGSITPMHKFFQQYADSTIIREYRIVGGPPIYRVLTKTDNMINSFCYEAIDTTWRNISSIRKLSPVILWNMLSAKKTLFQDIPADINIFFNISIINSDTTKKMWTNITQTKPWQLVDDRIFGNGCKNLEDPVISEVRPAIIHLITRQEIKTLFFMTPIYFEKLCPGNKYRQAFIKIDETIDKYFPKFKGRYY